VVDTREVSILEDGIPVEVKFDRTPDKAGEMKYGVRVRPGAQIREADESDNREEFTVNIVDRKTRVLIVAGGPMRDYHFVHTMLHRHKAVETDVWLQTVDASDYSKVSQEADEL